MSTCRDNGDCGPASGLGRAVKADEDRIAAGRTVWMMSVCVIVIKGGSVRPHSFPSSCAFSFYPPILFTHTAQRYPKESHYRLREA